MNAAIIWLEEQYEKTADVLARIRRGEPVNPAGYAVLREARVETGTAPPRPPATSWQAGQRWRWKPGEKPGPLDGRSHP